MKIRNEQDQQVIDALRKSKHYFPPVKIPEPKLVLDLGCWIGYTTIRFAKRWPNAQIVGVDADRSNYNLAVENTLKFPNIKIVHAAVGEPGRAQLADVPFNQKSLYLGGGDWVDVIRVDTLLGLTHNYGQPIDFVKIDIEGSEKDILIGNWLILTKSLLIDLHNDWDASELRNWGFKVKFYKPSASCPGGRVWATKF